ncbi:hypothetical protein CJF42_08565 [Pseudoalteromonas sp. NBT06-2]|uniref:hypothetical protein n=1 Tax=Pseudoalteromonas sp. NBT06-2 TaxID=2025950 RepID=UPI000BA62F66|nr:hypothetical protein [Pseudoalteromonas sp. NBT06-2]PAJ74848.1 hypothetical protein CJF42_08565 [Pseudoalteromonas sp. NBT06-2]
MDSGIYPTEQIRNVYFERWEIECGYGEIKHQLLDDSILLRSQSAIDVRQVICGILLIYNLIQVEISLIAKEANVSPLRISFCTAIREKVKQYILPEKRKRPKRRSVRISKIRYPIQSKHA